MLWSHLRNTSRYPTCFTLLVSVGATFAFDCFSWCFAVSSFNYFGTACNSSDVCMQSSKFLISPLYFSYHWVQFTSNYSTELSPQTLLQIVKLTAHNSFSNTSSSADNSLLWNIGLYIQLLSLAQEELHLIQLSISSVFSSTSLPFIPRVQQDLNSSLQVLRGTVTKAKVIQWL